MTKEDHTASISRPDGAGTSGPPHRAILRELMVTSLSNGEFWVTNFITARLADDEAEGFVPIATLNRGHSADLIQALDDLIPLSAVKSHPAIDRARALFAKSTARPLDQLPLASSASICDRCGDVSYTGRFCSIDCAWAPGVRPRLETRPGRFRELAEALLDLANDPNAVGPTDTLSEAASTLQYLDARLVPKLADALDAVLEWAEENHSVEFPPFDELVLEARGIPFEPTDAPSPPSAEPDSTGPTGDERSPKS